MQRVILLSILSFLLIPMSLAAPKDKTYYDSGEIHFEYSYQAGKLNGITKEYFETGELKAEVNYRDGKLDWKKEYLRNGKLKHELRLSGGKKYETEIQYYPTGELFRERTLINGKRHGLEIDYYKNGKKKAERNYINGKKEGNAKGYHNNGNVQGDWYFEDGVPVKAIIFYRSGERWLEHTDFIAGRLNGISQEYDKEGNLIALREYQEDQLIKRRRFRGWFGTVRGWFYSIFN